jgi:dihydroorotate dehydrogenase (NAD+) catalytic subunit
MRRPLQPASEGNGVPARAKSAEIDLSVRVGPLKLANPVLVASGTFGYGNEYAHVLDVARLGGVITKTVTPKPRAGNPPARIAETAGGMLNSIGLENVGPDRFRSEKLPKLRSLGATIIASIGADTPAELERLLDSLAGEKGIAGFEINFSCPNVAKGGARYWAVARRLEQTLARLRRLTRAALIAKLSPDVTSVADLARACEAGGADALTAVNTFVGMAVDLGHQRSKLGRATGGLSGPAIKPLALAKCAEAVAAVQIPVIGSGGIVNGRDALEFLAVGACAVQVGTATFVRPRAAIEVLDEIAVFLTERGLSRVTDWIGVLAAQSAPKAKRDVRRGARRVRAKAAR